jgi:hypothetical protein
MIAWTPASMPFISKEIARPPGSERPSSHPAATDHNEGFTTAAGAGIVCTGGSTSPGDDQPTGDSAEAIPASALRAAHRLRDAPGPGRSRSAPGTGLSPSRPTRAPVIRRSGDGVRARPGDDRMDRRAVVAVALAAVAAAMSRVDGRGLGGSSAPVPRTGGRRVRARPPRRCPGASPRRQRCEEALDRLLGRPTLRLRARTSARGPARRCRWKRPSISPTRA